MSDTILLTEQEAADRLRCKPSKVKRLRITGKLAYLPGRPPLIRLADLEIYIEQELKRTAPDPAENARQTHQDIRRRAVAKFLRTKARQNAGSK